MPSHPKRFVLDTALEVDRLCDQFEQEQARGVTPQIESYLDLIGPEAHTQLFEQLLALELEALQSRPLLADYRKRFPEFETQLESVWEDLGLLDWTDSKISRFQILEELGRGGMGVVFLAEDPSLQRRVAIKLLTRERQADANWLARLQQEARIASGLNHPNVLTIYEIGEDQGIPFIASEYVDGITLRERMGGKPLPTEDCLRFAGQICGGMAEAHRAGIIHRDLKTDNVMVRQDGIVKILDFGLAQSQSVEQWAERSNVPQNGTGSATPKTGQLTGTIHFMSPEQTRGEKLTSASDVFSFGVLLHLMLTSKLPFSGESESEVLENIRSEAPACSSSVLPAELSEILLRCLSKTAEQRPDFETIRVWIDSLRFGEQERGQSAGGVETESSGNGLGPSDIRYAQSGEVNIAWQTIGEGPIDIVFVMGWVSHLDWFWKAPTFAKFLKQLARFSRVILFDKRGTGLSDRVPVNQLPDLDTRMDDVRAVMEAAGSEKAVLCGVSEGGPLCALFAATHPSETRGLVMLGSYARRLWAEDYPWGPTLEQRDQFLQTISRDWGGPVGIEERAPSKANDPVFRDWWASYLRMGASPGAAVALTKMNAQIDIRPVLPSVRVPTLVIHRQQDQCLKVEEGRYLAERIPRAKFIELPGNDHLPFVGDAESVLNEIELFLTGMKVHSEVDSVLATLLNIELSSQKPEDRQLVGDLVAREATLFRGRNVSVDDGDWLIAFDGPVRAILCAQEIFRLSSQFAVELRCGLDTGTCNFDKSSIYGPAVDGAQSAAQGAPWTSILLTDSLKNLISSDEFKFEPFPDSRRTLYKLALNP